MRGSAALGFCVDQGDRSEVNPESWTQLKGSNEKGI